VRDLKDMKQDLEKTVRKLPSSSLLIFIKKSLEEGSQQNKFVESVLQIDPKYIPYTLAILAEAAFVHSNPYRGKMSERTLQEALICARAYSIHYSPPLDPQPTSTWRELIRSVDQQLPFQVKATPLSIALLWYLFMHLAQQKTFKDEFDIEEKFKEAANCDIESFLFVALGCWVLGRQTASCFNEEMLSEVKEPNIKTPSKTQIDNALKILCGSPSEYRELFENKHNSQSPHINYDLSILRTYPIMRPYRDKKEIFILFPDLLISQVIPLIYHILHNKFGTLFDEWFGELFEELCHNTLLACLSKQIILRENEIQRINEEKKIKKPDFLILDNEITLIIEAKVARIRRGIIRSDDQVELENTFTHLYNALKQISSLSIAISNNKAKHPKLDATKENFGIIITLENFFALNDKSLIQSHINRVAREKHNIIIGFDWLCIDILSLIKFQPYFKKGLTFSEIRQLLPLYGEIGTLGEIAKKYGASEFEESHLYPYFQEYWERLVKN
jgi:hypothetical protein